MPRAGETQQKGLGSVEPSQGLQELLRRALRGEPSCFSPVLSTAPSMGVEGGFRAFLAGLPGKDSGPGAKVQRQRSPWEDRGRVMTQQEATAELRRRARSGWETRYLSMERADRLSPQPEAAPEPGILAWLPGSFLSTFQTKQGRGQAGASPWALC